jgi:hypothetical protein
MLRSYRRDGDTLVLNYEVAAEPQVRELVERERQCCSFLDFRLDVEPDVVRLTIAGTALTADGIAALLEPFLAATKAPPDRAAFPPTSAPADAGGRFRGIARSTSVVAALACGVCCALPFAIPSTALAALGGAIAVIALSQSWFLYAAIGAAAGAAWIGIVWWRMRTNPGGKV